jgi:uncharacterized OB-fold protein
MANERDEVHPFEERVDHPYWAGLGRGELRIQRCTSCKAWKWPADWRCPDCGSYDLDWEVVDPTGRVYSWIRTHLPFVPGFADLVPYVTVLVELPQAGGARILGHLTGSEEGVRIGAPLTGTFVPASPRTTGLPVLTWALG